MGRLQSGQMHNAVNVTTFSLRGFESLPAHIFADVAQVEEQRFGRA